MNSAGNHPFACDDILVSAWGRDQDNIDFYQVIQATPKTLVVRQVDSRITEVVGRSQAVVVAVPGSLRGDALRRRLVHDQGEWSIYVSSWEQATLWSGAPRLSTRYA